MATADDPKTAQPIACAPCRGTGTVISNLGGTTSQVRCPWCAGSGTLIAGHDAQALARDAAAA